MPRTTPSTHAAGVGRVGRAEPQLVHHRDRPGAHRHDVADDAADAGGRALVRLDVGRVVVRLDLEGGRPAVADVDDAGVLADARQHRRPHRLGGGLAEVAQVHLRGLVGAVLAPHHRVHRQLGVGGPTAEDLADPLVLVVLEAEFAERLRLVGGGGGVVDGVDLMGEPGRHADQCSLGRRLSGSVLGHIATRPHSVAVGIGQHHPVEVRSPLRPAGLGGAQVDQPLDLRLDVGRGEVDVHAVLARRRIVDLLERQPGPPGGLTVTKNPGAKGFTVPSTALAHHSASRSGSSQSNVMFSTVSAMPLTLDQAGDRSERAYVSGNSNDRASSTHPWHA